MSIPFFCQAGKVHPHNPKSNQMYLRLKDSVFICCLPHNLGSYYKIAAFR